MFKIFTISLIKMYFINLVFFSGLISNLRWMQVSADLKCNRSYLWRSLAPESFKDYPIYDQSVQPTEILYTPPKILLSPEIILLPIQTPNYPRELVDVKNSILRYLQAQDVDINAILEPVYRYVNYASDLDLMIAALSRIREIVPENCDHRKDFNYLLIYLLNAKYQNLNTPNQSGIQTLDTNILEQIFTHPVMPKEYQQFPLRPFMDNNPNTNANEIIMGVQNALTPIITLLEKILAKMDELKKQPAILPKKPTLNAYDIRNAMEPVFQLLQRILAKIKNLGHLYLNNNGNQPIIMEDFVAPTVFYPLVNGESDLAGAFYPTAQILGQILDTLDGFIHLSIFPAGTPNFMTPIKSNSLFNPQTNDLQGAVSPIIHVLEQILMKLDELRRFTPGDGLNLDNIVQASTNMQTTQVNNLRGALYPIVGLMEKILIRLSSLSGPRAGDFQETYTFSKNYLGTQSTCDANDLQNAVSPIMQVLQVILIKLDEFRRPIRAADQPQVFIPPTPTQFIPTPTFILTESTTTEMPTTTTPMPPPRYQFLIEKLPLPKNDAERMHYATMTAFLSSYDLESSIGHAININAYKNEHDLMKALFARSITLKLSPEQLAAVKFYLEYEVALARLSLVTRKEIHKQFDLSGIILDTLDLHAFTDEQRVAFDEFFQYILVLKGEQMSTFDSWTEAKTKGQFMKLLFDFFLASTFVPDNIKRAILMIIPCIKMTGEGAEPV